MMEQYDWSDILEMNGQDLKAIVFEIIQNVAMEIHERESDDPEILSIIPRLSEIIQFRKELESFRQPMSTLARSVGLWNYIDKDYADDRDLLIAEAVSVPELGNVVLHREQVGALNTLLAGRNLILSAPTSFGKSLLIDALILTHKYKKIAIILPTIALLDEFRRRIGRRFQDTYEIIMYPTEKAIKERVIYLGTQERIINRTDIKWLDLLVVDEFYKLDSRNKRGELETRSLTLNVATYRLLKKAKQFYFMGPNIDEVRVSGDSPWKFEFIKTRFSTVAVDTMDLKQVADKKQRLKDEAFRESNWPLLIFVSSPERANSIALELAREGKLLGYRSDLTLWMEENYGNKWQLIECVAAGIGVHHARVPRSLSSRFVKLFNDGLLPIMLCTSTLIEGVNTAAKSIIIYDKKISRDDYDFFTFSNIKGRAGRLGQYHVGRVYVFNEEPGQGDVDVRPPVFGEYDSAPDELVVHLEQDDRSISGSDRVRFISSELGLDLPELRRLSTIGLDQLRQIRNSTINSLKLNDHLIWSGRPEWKHIEPLCAIACSINSTRKLGVRSPRQLCMYITKLRSSPSIKSFFDWYSGGFVGSPDSYDSVFQFLRSCEHSLPELFDAVQVFVGSQGHIVDYSLLLAELPRWFRSEELKQLEEQGIPIQLSERFSKPGDTLRDARERLLELGRNLDPRISKVEQEWIVGSI